MQRWKKSLAVGALVLIAGVSTGCMKNTWKTDLHPIRAEYEERNNHFIFGLVGHPDYNLDDFCADGKVAKVRSRTTFGNYLAAAFTFNIWTPRIMTVQCGRGDGDSTARIPTPTMTTARAGGVETQ